MRIKLLLLAFLVSSVSMLSQSVSAQTLVSYNLIRSYSTTQIDSIVASNGIPTSILEINYPVEIYKVTYMSSHPLNGPILASGAIVVPLNNTCALPLASYQHGTVYHDDDVPSRLDDGSLLVGTLFATNGYFVAMPDFIGLGDSPGMHPYIHADSEADAVMDMLRASRQILDSLGSNYNQQLFLFGYSQGGHATMAAHKKMQELAPFEFEVTASAPMAGPYDASGVQAEVITDNVPYPAPEYLPYVIFGLQDAYGNLYNSPSEVFVSPYDTTLPPLFDGQHTGAQIAAAMPSIPNQVIIPTVLDSFENDPNHPLRVALREQDLYDWMPWAPTRMVYCEADAHVSYLNAIVALDTMLANGATQVDAVSAGAQHDHGDCALYAFLAGQFFFDQHRVANNDMVVTWLVNHETNSGTADGSIAATAIGPHGPYTYSWSTGGSSSTETGLSAGVVVLTVTDTLGCSETHLITVGVASSVAELEADLELLNVYPNPAVLTVTIGSESPIRQVRIFDQSGREFLLPVKINDQQATILRGGSPAGIYLLYVETEAGVVQRKLSWQ